MRFIDRPQGLIEHNPMEIGRDTHGIHSLSRHFLEQVVALSSEGILVVDAEGPSLPVVYANAAYEALTGCAVSELADRPWSLLARDAESEPEWTREGAAIALKWSDEAAKPRVFRLRTRVEPEKWTQLPPEGVPFKIGRAHV